MKINLSHKNKSVYQLVKMMKYKNKPILFTGYAIERKAAFIKELRSHYPGRVTLNISTIPPVLPEMVRLVIVERVSDTETLEKWCNLHTNGFVSEMNPKKMIFPNMVIVTSIEKDKLSSLRPEILRRCEFIELK